tara:strand:- start:157 stop:888 length:732 start_codon:yes stop_codon:yes gene_type:complete
MIGKKIIAKKIAKTIKPKPKPKAPKQRIAQGNQPPGRTGTMQNPANKNITKTPPKKTAIKKTTPKKTSPASKAVPVPKKGVSNTAKAAGTAAVVGAGVALNKNKGESFDDAFRKARAKGEATLFTHNGKKYTAVTKDDLKRKGYSSLAAYNKAGGRKKVTAKDVKPIVDQVNKNKKRKRPVINAVKRVLLGKDKKFGGDKGLIDFIRKPKKKADGGMINSSKPKRSSRRGVGAAKRGFGKALR